jgi:hypothetical protein
MMADFIETCAEIASAILVSLAFTIAVIAVFAISAGIIQW